MLAAFASFVQDHNNLEAKQGLTDFVAQCDSLFHEDLNPVNPKAQKKVTVPEGLDLDAWINEPLEDAIDEKVDVHAFEGIDFKSKSSVESVFVPSASVETEVTRSPFILVATSTPETTQSQVDDIFGTIGSRGPDSLKMKDFNFEPTREDARVALSSSFVVRSDDEMPRGAMDAKELDISSDEPEPRQDLASIDLTDEPTVPVQPVKPKVKVKKRRMPKRTEKEKNVDGSVEDVSESTLSKLWSPTLFLCGDDLVRIKYETKSVTDHLEIFLHVAFRPQSNEKLRSVRLQFDPNAPCFGSQVGETKTDPSLSLLTPSDGKTGILLVEKQAKGPESRFQLFLILSSWCLHCSCTFWSECCVCFR